MTKISLARDEHVLAELSPTRRSLTFPVLELFLITGLIWLGIGLVDRYFDSEAMARLGYHLVPPHQLASVIPDYVYVGMLWLRRGLLVLWVVLAWRRCIRHMVYRNRSRMLLTNQRLITASGHWRSQTAQVPLDLVVDARARGTKVSVFVMGSRYPIELRDVPHSRRFVSLIRQYGRVR